MYLEESCKLSPEFKQMFKIRKKKTIEKNFRDSEMVQSVKVLAAKSNNLNLILHTHT